MLDILSVPLWTLVAVLQISTLLSLKVSNILVTFFPAFFSRRLLSFWFIYTKHFLPVVLIRKHSDYTMVTQRVKFGKVQFINILVDGKTAKTGEITGGTPMNISLLEWLAFLNENYDWRVRNQPIWKPASVGRKTASEVNVGR
uniref:Uncharacterized protein n=1 Tax=Cacopsylla melanoneura TaxID=428564 RepID=A0A8D8Z7B3_9HEMI